MGPISLPLVLRHTSSAETLILNCETKRISGALSFTKHLLQLEAWLMSAENKLKTVKVSGQEIQTEMEINLK